LRFVFVPNFGLTTLYTTCGWRATIASKTRGAFDLAAALFPVAQLAGADAQQHSELAPRKSGSTGAFFVVFFVVLRPDFFAILGCFIFGLLTMPHEVAFVSYGCSVFSWLLPLFLWLRALLKAIWFSASQSFCNGPQEGAEYSGDFNSSDRF